MGDAFENVGVVKAGRLCRSVAKGPTVDSDAICGDDRGDAVPVHHALSLGQNENLIIVFFSLIGYLHTSTVVQKSKKLVVTCYITKTDTVYQPNFQLFSHKLRIL